MTTGESIETVLSVSALIGAVQVIVSMWLSERLKNSLHLETERILESLRWDTKTREQAATAAEYLALAHSLKTPEDYRSANRLSWTLALWLPADLYRSVVRAIVSPSDQINSYTALIDVRKLLLGSKAGDLSQDDIAGHAPGIGIKK